jgi:16S rRNA (cytidine1402-2'-O)-methyltransferase
MPGTLYLVATPIGNLQDMTFRAVETLKSVDLVACEDTRHTRKLLTHFGISKKLVSYHEHNEAERSAELLEMLRKGMSVALVSDAGTPAISDPGFRIVREAISAGIAVIPIPGAVAFATAASAAGLATDAIFFGGFLPSKKGERRRRLLEVSKIPGTLAFYDSPRRLTATLVDALEVLGDRQAVIAREITKLHEEFLRGNLSELHSKVSTASLKGEIVLLIDRAHEGAADIASTMSLRERVAAIEADGLDRKAALKKAAKEFGVSRSEAYRMLHSDGI